LSTLLRRAGVLQPAQARSFLGYRFQVPPGAGGLRIRFAFAPPRDGRTRNLLTISLFDPAGFRGAGHRHAPEQEIVIGPREATPGFVPGPIEGGAWLIEIDCHAVLNSPLGGVEYKLEVVALPRAPAVDYRARQEPAHPLEAPAPRPPPFDPRAGAPAGWLKGDLHVHSNHSDGRWTVDEIARYVEQYQLDFVALTDHNTTSGIEGLQVALRRASLPAVLVPGVELTTFYGHANALGIEEWIDWRVRGPKGRPPRIGDGGDGEAPPAARTMEAAAAAVHRLGGTFVVNHPRAAGYPLCTGCRWEFGATSAAYADALEVWNGAWNRQQNGQALALWDRWLRAGRRVPATAGTDSHRLPEPGAALGFTYAWARRDPAAILAAVRAGHTYLSAGPYLAWHPWPNCLAAPSPDRLSIEVARLGAPADLRLMHDGRPIARETVAAGAAGGRHPRRLVPRRALPAGHRRPAGDHQPGVV
jgi:predicted metal-dependent phosphoesterase TrpH